MHIRVTLPVSVIIEPSFSSWYSPRVPGVQVRASEWACASVCACDSLCVCGTRVCSCERGSTCAFARAHTSALRTESSSSQLAGSLHARSPIGTQDSAGAIRPETAGSIWSAIGMNMCYGNACEEWQTRAPDLRPVHCGAVRRIVPQSGSRLGTARPSSRSHLHSGTRTSLWSL